MSAVAVLIVDAHPLVRHRIDTRQIVPDLACDIRHNVFVAAQIRTLRLQVLGLSRIKFRIKFDPFGTVPRIGLLNLLNLSLADLA